MWNADATTSNSILNNYRIAAILRSPAYSPNHIGADAQILMAVCARLRKRGREVAVYSEPELQNGDVDEEIVLSMCRDRRSIEILRQMEDSGTLIVNSPYGIENCKRGIMAPLLTQAGVGYVDSITVETDRLVTDVITKAGMSRCWVKRADFHSMHKEDITFARDPREAQRVLQEYFLRDIRSAVIERHIDGNLVKFYGVRSTDFFHYYYPAGADAEGENLPPVYNFSTDTLKRNAARAADVLGIDIYGGDCIVSQSGQITIINFNDWPSFSTCSDEAAPAIASVILSKIKQKFNVRRKNRQ